MSQNVLSYMQNMEEKKLKYDAIAVLKMAGYVTPSPGEPACQNHPEATDSQI